MAKSVEKLLKKISAVNLQRHMHTIDSSQRQEANLIEESGLKRAFHRANAAIEKRKSRPVSESYNSFAN